MIINSIEYCEFVDYSYIEMITRLCSRCFSLSEKCNLHCKYIENYIFLTFDALWYIGSVSQLFSR